MKTVRSESKSKHSSPKKGRPHHISISRKDNGFAVEHHMEDGSSGGSNVFNVPGGAAKARKHVAGLMAMMHPAPDEGEAADNPTEEADEMGSNTAGGGMTDGPPLAVTQ